MTGRVGVLRMGAALLCAVFAAALAPLPAHGVVRPALRQCDDLQTSEIDRSQCPSFTRYPHQVMLGDSITRKAKAGVQYFNRNMTVDALDGRSWEIPGRPNGTTMWQAFQQYLPGLRPHDWLVMETSRGDISVDTNKKYMDRLVAALPAHVCLAWVLPHTYYDTQDAAHTAAMKTWNTQMAALIQDELAKVRCHAVIDWSSVVETFTAQTPHQTAAQIKAYEPVCYDGRHPTPFGARIYGSLIASTLKTATAANAKVLAWPRYLR